MSRWRSFNTGWRGLATINAFGIYSLAYTNYGLYSGGNHTICSMVTLDGTNFWTTGQAGSGTVSTSTAPSPVTPMAPAFPAHRGSAPEAGASFSLSTACSWISAMRRVNRPERQRLVCDQSERRARSGNVVFTTLLYTAGASRLILPSVRITRRFTWPSPGFSTAWAPSAPATAASSGGIQTAAAATTTAIPCRSCRGRHRGGHGAQGLTVDFSANSTWGAVATGAKIYATSTGAATNSLVQVVDNGDPGTTAPTVTVLVTASPNQALRGVRFGPAAIAPAIASPPQTNTVPLGNSATFTVAADGFSAPVLSVVFWDHTAGGGDPEHFHHQQCFLRQRGELYLGGEQPDHADRLRHERFGRDRRSPTITPSPLASYVETAGDHLAWGPTITGTQPITNYWYSGSTLVQSNVTPGANGGLALANISTANNGTYRLYVTNFYGWASAPAR